MTFPILEYDPSPTAFIEPSQVIRPRDMPAHCVICFFKEMIDKIVLEHSATLLAKNAWEDGPHPVYSAMVFKLYPGSTHKNKEEL